MVNERFLEGYLQNQFHDKPNLSVTRLEKFADGWESDNYALTIGFGRGKRFREDWVLRLYSGSGSVWKAGNEYQSMTKLHAAGYPVPRVFLLEKDNSLLGKPFIIMEFIEGDTMWNLMNASSADRRAQLFDQFSRLFVQLHSLDWKQFDSDLPDNDPFFFIDRWINEARSVLAKFPEIEIDSVVDWVCARRSALTCVRPSPVHQDFHPGNIIITAGDGAQVIDWTNFSISDYRFDLSWTLVLAVAYRETDTRDQILRDYERQAGKRVEEIETFEAIACARRLFDITASLTKGSESMGMNRGAAETMRANMEPHRRVYSRFMEITNLRNETFERLFE